MDINPCNVNKSYKNGNTTYNLNNSVTPRYSLPYVKPTKELFLKHKNIILEYTTLTNGPGYTPPENATTQIHYKLNVDSVKFRNIIYTIPCRFRPYINDTSQGPGINTLLSQGNSIQNVFKILTAKYNIPDPTLNVANIYQFQRLYTYPQMNYTNNTITELPKTNTIAIPYKTRLRPEQSYEYLEPTLGIDWNSFLNLGKNIFAMQQYCQFIEVLNNDGVTFTSDFNDLYSGGSASYLGSQLVGNTVKSPNTKIIKNLLIQPQEQNRPKTYGYVINTTSNTILRAVLGTRIDYILFIPIQTLQTIMKFEPYPNGMTFTIDINSTIPVPVVPCSYVRPYNPPVFT